MIEIIPTVIVKKIANETCVLIETTSNKLDRIKT
jgi:hypothetical protein